MGWFLRVWYSFAIALSVAASTWGSTRDVNFWVRVGILAAAFFAALTAAYAFQGKDIQKSFEKRAIKSSVQAEVKTIIENSIKPEVEVKIENNDNKITGLTTKNAQKQKCCTKSSFASTISQLFNGTTRVGSSAVGSYFVLDTAWSLVGITASASVFWWVFGITLFVKLIFDLTNEGFATDTMIAESFGQDRPFYARFFRPLSQPMIVNLICTLGAANHTLLDDLLPWLGYLPKSAVSYLAKNPKALIAVGVIGGVVGGGLAVLIFAQTYYYEGTHTKKNLRLCKIADELKEAQSKKASNDYLPLCVAKILIKSIKIMPLLHGAASAMPVYFIVKELLANSSAKWPVDAIATLLVFLGVAIGVNYSEVEGAEHEIAERTPPAQKISENKVSENQPLLKDQKKSSDVSINPASANVSMTYF